MTSRRILVLGWLVFALYAYPGYTAIASLDMMLDGRYGEYSDWHSPLMSFVWRVVQIAVQGPFGMLLVQSGCLLFGMYALLRRRMAPRAAAIASAGVLVFPPVMAAMAVIDQDTMLAALLVVGTALITSERRNLRLVGLGVMMLACGMRDGAWLAVGPLVVFGFVWDAAQRRVVRYAIAVGAWLAGALLAYGLNNHLVTAATRQNETSLATFDLVGMLSRTDKLTDAQVRALAPDVKFVDTDGLQERARALRGKPRHAFAGERPLFAAPRTDDDVEALLAARGNLRAHDLGSYVATRWKQWTRILVPRKKRSMAYTDDGVSGDRRIFVGHAASHSAVQRGLIWSVRLFDKTPLFLPVFYLGLAVVLLPFARRQRQALLLLASGIAMELALAVVTWDFDYRYSTWLVVATVYAAILVVQGKLSPHRDQLGAAPSTTAGAVSMRSPGRSR